MGTPVCIIVLLGIAFSVQGKNLKASHLSNMPENVNLCAQSSPAAVSCSDAGADGLLPHPADCRLFYQCAYGVPFCHHCPSGLHYNPSRKYCDLPEQAGCVATPEPPTPSDASTILPTTADYGYDLHIETTPNKDIPAPCVSNSVTSVSCASVTSPDALLAHPDDCNLFYYCVGADAAPVCRQCPAALHFNPALRVCDVPERAGCVAPGAATDNQFTVLVA